MIWLVGCAEALRWTPCTGEFECATLERPDASLAVVRHPAERRRARMAVLVQGGPGASSIDLLQGLLPPLAEADPELWADVTWVAMDNRGVGQSDPVSCVEGAWFDDIRGREPVPADEGDEVALRASRDGFQEGCLADRDPTALSALGTATYADDLDAFREALGVDQIDLLGFSAGTLVGATYAALYPDHVGRFVLDGVVDPAPDRAVFLDAQAEGFDGALERFFARCAADEACAVHADPAGAYDRVAAATPLSTADGRNLTHNDLRWGVAGLLYGPDDVALAEGLAAADAGGGTLLMAATDAGWGRDEDGTYDPLYQRYWAIGCLDQPWPAGWTEQDVWAFGAELDAAFPRTGSSILTGELNCLGWPASAPLPPLATSAQPLLLVAGLYDPATPLSGAENMQAALDNDSALLTYDGDGHVALFTDGSGCVYAAEREFLLGGYTATATCP